MIAPRFLPASFGLFVSGAVALSPGAAYADCSDSSPCPQGFNCEVVGASSCPGYACPEGQPCPEPPPCEPTEVHECVPGPCSADADCADGMLCYTSTSEECSGTTSRPACAPDMNCEPPEPPADPVCVTKTSSLCVPRYMVPCTAAADCGEGFDCVPEKSCWCSGSSGGGGAMDAGTASGGGSDPAPGAPVPNPPVPAPPPGTDAFPPPPIDPPLPPECGCTEGPNSMCQVKDIMCRANSDCPTGWACRDIGGPTVCTGGVPSNNGDAAAFAPPNCTTAPVELRCVPPYADLPIVGGGVAKGEDGSSQDPTTPTGVGGAATGGPVTGGPGAVDAGAPPPPNAPPQVGNTPPEPVNNDADDTPKSGSSDSKDEGGCQMTRGRAGTSGASLLALLGLAGFARRRRARAA